MIVSGADAELARPRQRSAAADRQGRRLRAGLPVPDRIAADPRWFGLPAGLPDRAVHPRRQDRLPLRRHHRDPGAGLLLPQDRPRPGRGAAARRRPDPEVPRQRHRPPRTRRQPRNCWPTRGRRSAGDGRRADRVSARLRSRTPASCTALGLESVPFLLAVGDLSDRLAAAAAGRDRAQRARRRLRRSTTAPSTPERSPPQHFSRRTCCRGWPPSEGSSTLST